MPPKLSKEDLIALANKYLTGTNRAMYIASVKRGTPLKSIEAKLIQAANKEAAERLKGLEKLADESEDKRLRIEYMKQHPEQFRYAKTDADRELAVEGGSVVKGLLDFVPVVGDGKALAEADSGASLAMALIGLVPGGDVFKPIIKKYKSNTDMFLDIIKQAEEQGITIDRSSDAYKEILGQVEGARKYYRLPKEQAKKVTTSPIRAEQSKAWTTGVYEPPTPLENPIRGKSNYKNQMEVVNRVLTPGFYKYSLYDRNGTLTKYNQMHEEDIVDRLPFNKNDTKNVVGNPVGTALAANLSNINAKTSYNWGFDGNRFKVMPNAPDQYRYKPYLVNRATEINPLSAGYSHGITYFETPYGQVSQHVFNNEGQIVRRLHGKTNPEWSEERTQNIGDVLMRQFLDDVETNIKTENLAKFREKQKLNKLRMTDNQIADGLYLSTRTKDAQYGSNYLPGNLDEAVEKNLREGLFSKRHINKKGQDELLLSLPDDHSKNVRVVANMEPGEYTLHKSDLKAIPKEDRVRLLKAQAESIPQGGLIVNHGKSTLDGIRSRLNLSKHGYDVLTGDHIQGIKDPYKPSELLEFANKYNLQLKVNNTGKTLPGSVEANEYYFPGIILKRNKETKGGIQNTNLIKTDQGPGYKVGDLFKSLYRKHLGKWDWNNPNKHKMIGLGVLTNKEDDTTNK